MKKILVTGLSGFIGSHVEDYLIEKGYEILAVSTKERTNTRNITWYKCNLLDENETTEFLQKTKPAYLLHLAWDVTPGEYMESPKNLSWLNASKHLLNNFKENGGKRAVIAGTQLEYNSNALYPAAKKALLEFLEDLEISSAEGRIFYLFGENENPRRLVPYIINSFLNKEEICYQNPDKILDLMYVKDVAKAFVELLDSEVQGVVDIGTGEGIKIKDLATKIAKLIENKEFVGFISLDKKINEIGAIIADNTRLKNEVGFSPEFNIYNAIKKIIELRKKKA